jgi:hypothetical protein
MEWSWLLLRGGVVIVMVPDEAQQFTKPIDRLRKITRKFSLKYCAAEPL